ncbi:hypothetical protein PZE06_13040 [Robertmurraya sp. DFI.2.37]|jgi:hypothetical protein|uniref:hypothetical protein n=1 Tax=Robertmurraya sp. DFI.2.37 TaxID=3031819 RepID=UPI001245BA73|nr:hypothetical protein [Robertmurraya sp. DFI.2.37]MDF1509097.1 hypothetical protein [Robertmurraya sp. DFI.2.37]
MAIEIGTKFQISKEIKGYYNSARALTITNISGQTVQFILGDGKGHGSMPLQHLHYLLKRTELTQIANKRQFIQDVQTEEEIG